MMYVLYFIITIFPLVLLHELGHYYVARRLGVKVEQFSIGFGPTLFSVIDRLGTNWCVSLIPLGGFVKMEDKGFVGSHPWKRILIVAAGPFVNYIFAFVLISGLFLIYGNYEIPAVVEFVESDSPAEKAGLLVNDRVISLDGESVKNFNELREKLFLLPLQDIELRVQQKIIHLKSFEEGEEKDVVHLRSIS